jgi:hypothetical protein
MRGQPAKQVRMVRVPPQERMQERPVGPCFTARSSTSTPARLMELVNRVPHSSNPRQPSSLQRMPSPASPRVVLAALPPALE